MALCGTASLNPALLRVPLLSLPGPVIFIKNAGAVLSIEIPITLVNVTVGKDVVARSLLKIVAPVTGVNVAVWPSIIAMSMSPILVEFSYVQASVAIELAAHAMAFAFNPGADV